MKQGPQNGTTEMQQDLVKRTRKPVADWPNKTKTQERLLNDMLVKVEKASKLVRKYVSLEEKQGRGHRKNRPVKIFKNVSPPRRRELQRAGQDVAEVMSEFHTVATIKNGVDFDSWTGQAFEWIGKKTRIRSKEDMQTLFQIDWAYGWNSITFDDQGLKINSPQRLVFNFLPSNSDVDTVRFHFKVTQQEQKQSQAICAFEFGCRWIILTPIGYYFSPKELSPVKKGLNQVVTIALRALKNSRLKSKQKLAYKVGESLTILIHMRDNRSEWIVKDSDDVQRFVLPVNSKDTKQNLRLMLSSSASLSVIEVGKKTVLGQ